jgi:ABC-type oligopeptide transport system ATPase subunit
MALKLVKPTSGEIYFDTIEISRMWERKSKKPRRRMGIVFQDSSASLNLRMAIRQMQIPPKMYVGS